MYSFLKRNVSENRKGFILLYIPILLDKPGETTIYLSKRDFHFHQGYYTHSCGQYASVLNTKNTQQNKIS